MTLHLFRPNEEPSTSSPPVEAPRTRRWGGRTRWITCLVQRVPSRLPRAASIAASLLWLVGLALQVWMVWAAGELLDLYVSAVELWAELARKHLELSLS